MSCSGTNHFSKKVLLQSKRFASGLRTTRRSQDDEEERERLISGEAFVPQSLNRPSPPPQLRVVNSSTPDLDDVTLLRRYAQMAREFLSTLPSPGCPLLNPKDLELMDEQPVAAGGYSDVRKAKNNGRNVVLKAHRCYRLFDIAQVVARFRNEVHAYNLLHHGGVDVVRLVGAYSTDTIPFGLVYEYMDNLDLKQHLRNEPNVGRLQLLTGIARCLKQMHDLGIVHGDFHMAHVLIDKYGAPRIGGLGNASVLPYSTARTAEGRTSAVRPSHNRAPESVGPEMSPNVASVTYPTKAGDLYSFGAMAFEVLTGRPPFVGMVGSATTHPMLSASRPSLPDRHEVSDPVWRMIQSFWDPVESRRMPIEEVVVLLEAELGRLPAPSL